MRKGLLWAVAAVVLMVCSPTWATIWDLDANLDGLQEVPPNASPAFGLGDFKLDDVANTISVTSGTYQDLLGGATAVTLNDAPIGTNGPLISLLTLDTPGANTGTFSSGAIPLTPALTADILAGKGYVNIRSQVFPSGEIRGQLFVVPEPASLGLLAAGGALTLLRRRRA